MEKKALSIFSSKFNKSLFSVDQCPFQGCIITVWHQLFCKSWLRKVGFVLFLHLLEFYVVHKIFGLFFFKRCLVLKNYSSMHTCDFR